MCVLSVLVLNTKVRSVGDGALLTCADWCAQVLSTRVPKKQHVRRATLMHAGWSELIDGGTHRGGKGGGHWRRAAAVGWRRSMATHDTTRSPITSPPLIPQTLYPSPHGVANLVAGHVGRSLKIVNQNDP